MKKIHSLLIKGLTTALLIVPVALYAQDQPVEQPAQPANQYVKGTFEYGVVINDQTVESLSKQSLDFIIQHRFGVIDNNSDLFGLYAPSNIRLGLDYGITSRLSAGVGATKDGMQYDLDWKYVLLKQEAPNGIPVTVTYYGNVARSAMDEQNFLDQDDIYKGANRLSYFNELMVARKITKRLSVQAAFTYTHFNLVDSLRDQIKDHDFYGGTVVGRYKFSPQSSVLFDFGFPFKQRSYVTTVTTGDATNGTTDVTTVYYPKVDLGLGFEVSTGSHQFQVFACTANSILNQEISVYNTNNALYSKSILIGFNITRQWGLK